PGEVVGVIGRNGAGKSTLLKILSRITTPTGGRAELYGRVSSLLEVGTGFHPELSGRENIFLNGSILGMKRGDIKRRLDEIVAFAEVERFLDTPVKHYSSGMHMRLAFAVAAYLEPEILIVDEVLAVGDAQFQKKCLGKMDSVAKNGRTILFVSHNMAAVSNLCRRGLVLERGRVAYAGTQEEAVARYLTSCRAEQRSLRDRTDRVGSGSVRVVALDIKDERGRVLDMAASGQDVSVCLHYESSHGFQPSNVIAGLCVKTLFDTPVFLQHNRLTGDEWGTLPARGAFVCRIPRLPLPPAAYKITYSLMRDGEYLDAMEDAYELTVTDGDFFGSGEVPPATHGCCLVDARWHVEAETASREESAESALDAGRLAAGGLS
ncbi:MAG: ABC transporter ATP-binding protein, partial [Pyrinomonadaceae bacterium]